MSINDDSFSAVVDGTKVFNIENSGTITPTLPEYINDAAADADGSLPSGAFYKIIGDRVVYQKA